MFTEEEMQCSRIKSKNITTKRMVYNDARQVGFFSIKVIHFCTNAGLLNCNSTIYAFQANLWLNGTPLSIQNTHWGRVTHICVSRLTIIDSYNGLSPPGAKPLSEQMLEYCWLGPWEIQWNLIEIYTFSFMKIHWKMAVTLTRPHCVN